MPRLFVGLELPDDIAFELELMRGGDDGARWIDRDAFHLTLRFIGDVDGDVADDIDDTLSDVDAEAFPLRLKGVGSFGGKAPRAIWAGVEPTPALHALQADVERRLQRIGLAPETRKFTPHVTLARMKHVSLSEVQAYLSNYNLYRSREFVVRDFILYSSRPSRGGGPYVAEERYQLAPDR